MKQSNQIEPISQEIDQLKKLMKTTIRQNNSVSLSLNLYHAFFENSTLPFFICLFDAGSHDFIEVGASCELLLGYTREEMNGTNMSEYIVDAEDVVSSIRQVEENMNKRKSVNGYENRYWKKGRGKSVRMKWYSDGIDPLKTIAIAVVGD